MNTSQQKPLSYSSDLDQRNSKLGGHAQSKPVDLNSLVDNMDSYESLTDEEKKTMPDVVQQQSQDLIDDIQQANDEIQQPSLQDLEASRFLSFEGETHTIGLGYLQKKSIARLHKLHEYQQHREVIAAELETIGNLRASLGMKLALSGRKSVLKVKSGWSKANSLRVREIYSLNTSFQNRMETIENDLANCKILFLGKDKENASEQDLYQAIKSYEMNKQGAQVVTEDIISKLSKDPKLKNKYRPSLLSFAFSNDSLKRKYIEVYKKRMNEKHSLHMGVLEHMKSREYGNKASLPYEYKNESKEVQEQYKNNREKFYKKYHIGIDSLTNEIVLREKIGKTDNTDKKPTISSATDIRLPFALASNGMMVFNTTQPTQMLFDAYLQYMKEKLQKQTTTNPEQPKQETVKDTQIQTRNTGNAVKSNNTVPPEQKDKDKNKPLFLDIYAADKYITSELQKNDITELSKALDSYGLVIDKDKDKKHAHFRADAASLNTISELTNQDTFSLENKEITFVQINDKDKKIILPLSSLKKTQDGTLGILVPGKNNKEYLLPLFTKNSQLHPLVRKIFMKAGEKSNTSLLTKLDVDDTKQQLPAYAYIPGQPGNKNMMLTAELLKQVINESNQQQQ